MSHRIVATAAASERDGPTEEMLAVELTFADEAVVASSPARSRRDPLERHRSRPISVELRAKSRWDRFMHHKKPGLTREWTSTDEGQEGEAEGNMEAA